MSIECGFGLVPAGNMIYSAVSTRDESKNARELKGSLSVRFAVKSRVFLGDAETLRR
jgi:hypothetical protein